MTRSMCVIGLMLSLGCGTGVIQSGDNTGVGDPDVEVARFSLGADDTGALQSSACVNHQGPGSCARYPNPGRCEGLDVSIKGDGVVEGACLRRGRTTAVHTVARGLPIMCSMDDVRHCLTCVDFYGEVLFDTCEGLMDDVAGAGAAPKGGLELCAPAAAHQAYIDKLNAVLAKEGLGLTFSSEEDPSTGFIVPGVSFDVCERNSLEKVGLLDECEPEAGSGACYCYDTPGAICRCARIAYAALKDLCAQLEANGCLPEHYGAAVWKVLRDAIRWLNKGRGDSDVPLSLVKNSEDIECRGSPLVLDMAGDGISLTSLEEGVPFPLTEGITRTAWIRGDDALLVFDRDGNGRIDDAGELFGEATAPDGFAALLVLDEPAQGGNANGIVEVADLMFGQLQLWRDSNGDGISQALELRPLLDEGIIGLETNPTRHSGLADAHGNDLSIRARFYRKDGSSGLLVDVLL
ncbi:MAG: hypothetical protein JRH20_22635 [Deltaproteobacteria bacterium]|nr:hypothetical protein [Deltaproteobacteria bacterium]